jgi:MoxR-like ATPase
MTNKDHNPDHELEWWELCETVLPHAYRVLLYGPPATGKTYTALYARPENTPAFSCTLTQDTPVAELRGHFIQDASGAFSWMDGPAIRAWRAGARLVVNELHKMSQEVEAFLHVIADDTDSAILTLPTGETVKPSPGFSIVGTMNEEPNYLGEALLDRFTIAIECSYPHPEAIMRLSRDLRPLALKTATAEESRRVSLRSWLEFDRLRTLLPPKTAAQAVFGVRATELVDALNVAAISNLLPDKGAYTSRTTSTATARARGPRDSLEEF